MTDMQYFEVEVATLLKIILVLSGLVLLYTMIDIVLLLFIAYILMAAINPVVARLEEYAFPRWLAVLTIFVTFGVFLGTVLSLTVSPLLAQTQSFIGALPGLLQEVFAWMKAQGLVDAAAMTSYLQEIFRNWSSALTSAPADIIRVGSNIFGGLLDIVMVFIFTFYLALEREKVQSFLVTLIPFGDKEKLSVLFGQVDQRLGAWLRGQLLLMTIIGFVTYILLKVIGLQFALPLAVLAGLAEVVPIVGPTVSAIPAMIVGLSQSITMGVVVVFIYILIQQLESSTIVPRVMGKSVGLDPLVVIIALMVGGRLAGPIGALLSVPVAAVLMIGYQEWKLDENL